MSVSVLKLEDDSLLAFNLNHVTEMMLDVDGLYFVCGEYSYATYSLNNSRMIQLHSSILEEGNIYSPKAMFDKFCNQ